MSNVTRDELALRIATAVLNAYFSVGNPFHAAGPLVLSEPMRKALTKAVLAELDAVTEEESDD